MHVTAAAAHCLICREIAAYFGCTLLSGGYEPRSHDIVGAERSAPGFLSSHPLGPGSDRTGPLDRGSPRCVQRRRPSAAPDITSLRSAADTTSGAASAAAEQISTREATGARSALQQTWPVHLQRLSINTVAGSGADPI